MNKETVLEIQLIEKCLHGIFDGLFSIEKCSLVRNSIFIVCVYLVDVFFSVTHSLEWYPGAGRNYTGCKKATATGCHVFVCSSNHFNLFVIRNPFGIRCLSKAIHTNSIELDN